MPDDRLKEAAIRPRGRVLDPMDRISEVLFGLIMALTFTLTLGVATADDVEVRTMLLGALGCNLAWGIIDAGAAPTIGIAASRGRRRRRRPTPADGTDPAPAGGRVVHQGR